MNKRKRYHFIGIGGIGMSALAHILLDKQVWVQGSDSQDSPILKELEKKGAVIHKGQSASNISRADTVVYSSAIGPDNPEFQAAEALGCKMLHRSQLLAELSSEYKTVAIAGTHGKTTTSSMLTAIFLEAKLDPSYAIGGLFDQKNGVKGTGGHFLFEADESDGSLINYSCDCAIITNIEAEHMDYYKTEAALFESYKTFASQVKDYLLYNGDAFSWEEGESFGFSDSCMHQIRNFEQIGWQIRFDLDDFEGIEVAATGRHNALNAAAAFLMAHHLGVPTKAIRMALKGFRGVKRRCEKRKEKMEILRIDDYAHHPTEILTTLRGIKEAIGSRRLVVLFQPHRYSRTRDHLAEFKDAFEWADKVYITDIYRAREEVIPGLTAHHVLNQIEHKDAHYIERLKCDTEIELRPHDVFVIMGAGDITNVEMKSEPRKWKVAVVAGGNSPEHEISLRSAAFVFESLDPSLYEKELITLPKEGTIELSVIEKLKKCEVVLPIMHGPNVEDGAIQGFFKTLGIPFSGADHTACGIAMNKALSKELILTKGVPTPAFKSFSRREWIHNKEGCLQHSFSYPVYVKAVHLGSSIGVSLVKKPENLEEAICHAFEVDHEVMIEEGKTACREFEFAALGNEEVQIPSPGEKLARGAFVDYEMKYGKNPVPTSINPTLSKEVLKKGQKYARMVYETLRMSGFARIDFLLDPQNNWWFMEINPIPGMQKLSLFPKIWNREGLPANRLVDELVITALARARC